MAGGYQSRLRRLTDEQWDTECDLMCLASCVTTKLLDDGTSPEKIALGIQRSASYRSLQLCELLFGIQCKPLEHISWQLQLQARHVSCSRCLDGDYHQELRALALAWPENMAEADTSMCYPQSAGHFA